MVLRHVPLLLVQGDGKLSEKDEADMQNAECMQYVTSLCVLEELPVHTNLYMQVYWAVLMQMHIDRIGPKAYSCIAVICMTQLETDIITHIKPQKTCILALIKALQQLARDEHH